MFGQGEHQPTPVPERARQVGEAQGRWSWVEPCAWTERMLAALEQGVKGGKWHSLMDKVASVGNLRSAFERVKRNVKRNTRTGRKEGTAGVDHQTVAMFENHLEQNLEALSESLRNGKYRPDAVKRVWIPKPGSRDMRPLGVPTVRDRVVQGALRNLLEPIFERDFAVHSYGFRPGRGCKDALRQVAARLSEGHTWVVDADLKSYFDSIPHERLLERIAEKVADGSVLRLVEAYLIQGVLDGMTEWEPERGTPQGAVISPLLSNIYLDPLDHQMEVGGFRMTRYADDFVILCRTREDAERALALVQAWTTSVGLTLHPEKTRIVDATQAGGFDFLGYHFERGHRWPRAKSLKKLKDAIRVRTRRTNGHSLAIVIKRMNPVLRGWFEYFKHSYVLTFDRLDGWVRMRLRSLLRRRLRLRGRGRGRDHQRWPNAYFAAHGLFSLLTAHAAVVQSSSR